MHCNNCGIELSDGTQFCPNCGNKVEAPTVSVTTAPAQAAAPAPTPAAVPADNSGEPTMSKAEFKEAKNAYKQARRAAGKSHKPMVIGIIIAIIVVAALASFATWYFMSQQGTPESAEPAAQVQTSQASSAGSAVEDADDPYAKYLGTWEGELTSTEGSYSGRCYGAEDEGMELTIESISKSGRMKASAKILYHGHAPIASGDDVDTLSGDAETAIDDLTGTFDESGFTFNGALKRDGDKVEIRVTPKIVGSTIEYEVEVKSYYDDKWSETDTFTLTKED